MSLAVGPVDYTVIGQLRLMALLNSHGRAARDTFLKQLSFGLMRVGLQATEANLLTACGLCTQAAFDASVEATGYPPLPHKSN